LRIALALTFTFIMCGFARADIVIGVAGPMTGQYQSFGEQMLRGVQSAIDEINAHGGISGEYLKLDQGDDGCDARKTEETAHKFVTDGASVIIGHFCSNAALIGAKIYEAAGIPMIAPSASLPSLAEGAGWNVIRLASRDDHQGDFAAARINRDYANGQVGLLDDGSASAKALVARLTATLAKPPALTISFKPDQSDFSGLVKEVQAKNIDIIYFAANAGDAGRIAAALTQGGVSAQFFGPDTILADEYGAKAGMASEGAMASFSTDPQSHHRAKAMVEALKIAGTNADGATLPSYAALQLYATAAVQVGAKNGHAIADWLRSGTSIETVLGDLKFDKNGEVQPPRFTWYRWSNGSYSAETLKK
jgi:branched-chain amino acid transport system substrate-binding protein